MRLSLKGRNIDVYLPPRSLLVLTGESRQLWKHGIAARKSDLVNGVRVKRERRVSLSFREILRAEKA